MLIDDHETMSVLQEEEGFPILAYETTEWSVGGPRSGSGPLRRVVAGNWRIETLGRLVNTNLGVYVVRWMGKERRPARKPAPYELTVSPAPSFGHTRPLRLTLVELTDRDPTLGGCDTLPHGPLDKSEDRPRMRKPNLGLGRVYIDVDVVRRQPQIDHHTRPAKPTATTT
jgi:hypothetical protein